MTNAAAMMTALGDPTRQQIFDRLASGPSPVGELARDLPVSRPAVSQHLKVLERAGLISRRREGQRRPCHLQVERLAEAARWFDHTRQAWQARFDRLERFLESVDSPPAKKGDASDLP